MLLPLAMLLLGSAAPIDASAEMVRRIEDGPAPSAVVVCAPIGPVIESVTALPPVQQAIQKAVESDKAKLAALALLSSEGLAAVGLDPAGAWSVELGEKHDEAFEVTMGIQRKEVDVNAFFKQLPGAQVRQEGDTWRIDDGRQVIFARVGDSRLTLRLGELGPNTRQLPPLPRALITDLPTGAGCAMFFDVRMIGTDDGDDDLAAFSFFVPLAGGPGNFMIRFLPGEPMDVPLARSRGKAALGSSREPPLLVATLRVPPNVLLTSGPLKEKATPDMMKALRGPLRIRAGMSIAAFGELGQLLQESERDKIVVVGAIPVRGRFGQPLSGRGVLRRLARIGGKDDTGFQRTGPRQATLAMKDKTVYLETSWNRIWFSTRQEKVREAASGEGQRWGGEGHAQRSDRWPVALTLNGSLPKVGPIDTNLNARVSDGMLELAMEPTPGTDVAMLGGMIGALAMPGFVQMQNRSKRSEIQVSIDTIYLAQQMYFEEHDRYLPLPPAPRAVQALDKEKVPWTSPPEWAPLGWSPEGPLRGTYWVEVSDDGTRLTVHGQADLDGDGKPCHFIRTLGADTQQLTDKDVY